MRLKDTPLRAYTGSANGGVHAFYCLENASGKVANYKKADRTEIKAGSPEDLVQTEGYI